MRFSILWPAIPWVLVAQQSARPEDLCAIEGRVANAASGAPVRKATVLITRSCRAHHNGLPP